MPILIYGMNHTTAPLAVRERAAFLQDELRGAASRLLSEPGVEEALVLSTCNRTELVVSARSGAAGAAVRGFLRRERRLSEEDLDRHCYLHAGPEAVRHLFRTACSLDSMIIGEVQILGQVKEAYAAAAEAGTLGTVLESLMQRSFAAAKRVRTRTGISRAPVSVASVAARLAHDIFGDLQGRATLVVGAGEMARLVAKHLQGGGAAIVVAGRSAQRTEELARDLGGRAVSFDRLAGEMERADVVVASTAAPGHVVTYEDAQRVSRARRGRPLFLVDIAVPRDVDPRVNTLDNVYLYDIDDLQKVVHANLNGRAHEGQGAEAIVEHETESFLAWLSARDVAPTIVALRRHLHAFGSEELARFRGRLAELSPGQQEVVRQLAEALVNKVLHPPTEALKRAARDGADGVRVRLLRELFGLVEADAAPAPRPEDP
ncbi:MAG: glutamyl-tRNA reductase [Candidatus Polarisedimenticolia bacterium]